MVSSDDEPVTFINVFEIPEHEVETFIAQWEHRSRLIAAADGFISAELHRATEPAIRFQLINVSKWESRAHLEAATQSPQFRDELDSYASAPTSTWTPNRGIYRTAAKLA